MLLAFHFSNWERGVSRLLEGNGYMTANYISALSVALIMLFPQILFFMPLYACLVGGDMVAKEAEDGTLRMILSRPISRLRLLFIKWCAGVVFSDSAGGRVGSDGVVVCANVVSLERHVRFHSGAGTGLQRHERQARF